MKRTHDWVYIAGFTLTLPGFTAIGVGCFVSSIADMSSIDGRCRIGIPRYITIPLVSYDVGLNILLTLIFVYLLSPLICSGKLSMRRFPASRLTKLLERMCCRSKSRASLIQANQGNHHMVKTVERLLVRTFIGSVLVMLPTVGNIAALSALGGRELGWLCLTTCTFDGSKFHLPK